MSGMTDADEPQGEKPSPHPYDASKDSPVGGRVVMGGALLLAGLWLVTQGEGVGIGLGVVCLVGAAYQLLVVAIAKGTHEGRSS